jgi:hypothetical protein
MRLVMRRRYVVTFILLLLVPVYLAIFGGG